CYLRAVALAAILAGTAPWHRHSRALVHPILSPAGSDWRPARALSSRQPPTLNRQHPWRRRNSPASARICAPRFRARATGGNSVTEVLQVMLLNNIKAKHPASQIVAMDWGRGVAVVDVPRRGRGGRD